MIGQRFAPDRLQCRHHGIIVNVQQVLGLLTKTHNRISCMGDICNGMIAHRLSTTHEPKRELSLAESCYGKTYDTVLRIFYAVFRFADLFITVI